MLGTPVDAWYGWLGASLVAVGLFGIAAGLPTTPPPDATAAARSVDATGSSPYAGESTVALQHSDELRLTPRGLSLRGDGGSSHATFQYGPVTPVLGRTSALTAVLEGTPPGRVFDSPSDLERAARRARNRDPEWTPAPEALRVRHVTWGGVDVALVG